eukprot:COSAG05_NODE_1959_length_3783_cov_1.671010_3_plen_505_part_01
MFEAALNCLSPSVMACFKDGDELKAPVFMAGDMGSLRVDSGKFIKRAETQRVAILFSGGPAPGGHNVVAGVKALLPAPHVLYGVKAGPKGLLAGDLFELSDEEIAEKLNLGGFDLLGSDRTKIKTKEQFDQVRKTVQRFSLTGIIVVGGDDSNTNALLLAEQLEDLSCQVIGVPKTIDGDLQVGDLLPISFGFDTASKVYAELVGNILQDTPSSRKYWHVVKLMGRSASHIALEVGLKTRPAVTLISEAVLAKKQRLQDLVAEIAQVIEARAKAGKHYGVILVPEGLIEFIPEYQVLIQQLNRVMARLAARLEASDASQRYDIVYRELDEAGQDLLDAMPANVRDSLLMDRDAHGNVQVSQIPTESLLIHALNRVLAKEVAFKSNTHFFGYEGRCAAPSLFDAALTYNMGLCASALLLNQKSAYMACVSDLTTGGQAYGVSLANLVQEEERGEEKVRVIEKALVTLDSPAYQALEAFEQQRDVTEDDFVHPGPIQFFGDEALTKT